MTREELLQPIVQSIRKGTSLSAPAILASLKDWDATPGFVDGQHVATLVSKGTEVHFSLVPGWRPKASHRGAIRELLRPVFDRYGFLTTRVRHDRPHLKTFVRRVGFHPTWRDTDHEYFLLGRLPFERKD